MIRKLRAKFVLINMVLVSIVLIITFVIVYLSTYQRLVQESDTALRMVVNQAGDRMTPPEWTQNPFQKHPEDMGSAKLPVMPSVSFCVLLDSAGSIVDVVGEYDSLMDAGQLQTVVADCLNGQGNKGITSSFNLRYLRQNTPFGTRIGFVDRENEENSLTSLVQISLLVGLGGLLAFFFISLFLSGLALKPVKLAWEQQKQFVADASHELKTPLTVILANIGILRSHPEETVGEQMKWVDYIGAEASRMNTLVGSLLFLAKTDDSKKELIMSEVNLSDAVWNAVLPFESVAFENGRTLHSGIDPGLFIIGDEGMLRRLTVILLDNACKYSNEGGTVTVLLSQSQDKIRLSVHNTGDPIPPEQQEHLFERFYRADESRAREKGGYGLGLAIAQSIAERHKARLTVQSGDGEGTTFAVVFQAARRKRPI